MWTSPFSHHMRFLRYKSLPLTLFQDAFAPLCTMGPVKGCHREASGPVFRATERLLPLQRCGPSSSENEALRNSPKATQ